MSTDEPRHPAISPPIVFVDENGEAGPFFPSVEYLFSYMEWPEQFDEPAHAYDSSGRLLTLTVDATDTPVVASVSEDADINALDRLLRPIARDRPMRFRLLDADVDLDTLLRVLWPHMRYVKGPYPGG